MKGNMSREKMLSSMESAVGRAAELLLRGVQSGKKVASHRKADYSLVTELDLELHRFLLSELSSVLPCVSEEDEATHSLIGSAEPYFVVDPLDGTSSCKRFMNVQGGQVGFGPLVGLVENKKLVASTFFNLPVRTLFSAIRGKGVWAVSSETPASPLPALAQRRMLSIQEKIPLVESGVLFYPGKSGETEIIDYLRSNNLVENIYRFGGFANDCSRLALGYEQVQIQFSVKAWDFAAALIPLEAGLVVQVDPRNGGVALDDWEVAHSNPVMIAPPGLVAELGQYIKSI